MAEAEAASLHGAAALAAVDLLVDRERHADALLAEAAEALQRSGARAVTGATHALDGAEGRRVVLTIEASGVTEDALGAALDRVLTGRGGRFGARIGRSVLGDPGLAAGLDAALAAHRSRSSGRVAVFPDPDAAPVRTVTALLDRTPIDRVLEIAAGDADPAAVVRTRGHLRPRWQGGALVLHVQPADGGALVPFETPDPTPCCAAHA